MCVVNLQEMIQYRKDSFMRSLWSELRCIDIDDQVVKETFRETGNVPK